VEGEGDKGVLNSGGQVGEAEIWDVIEGERMQRGRS